VSPTDQPPRSDGLAAGPPAPAGRSWRRVVPWALAAVVVALAAFLVLRRTGSDATASLESRPLAAQPPVAAAAEAYRQGMALMQQYRWAEAVPFLRKAAALDPKFALPWLRLTVALYFLGNSTEVVDDMQAAVRLSAGAPDDVRLRVEPHYFWYRNDWERCAASARALRDREPDNFEALLPSLLLTGCVPAPESLSLLARLRATGSPTARDPRFDLMEARLALAEHEDRRAAEALDRADTRISGAEGRFLQAAALLVRSRLAARAGHFDEALALLAQAEKTYVEGGHAFEAARVAGERALVLEAKGEFLPAAREFERQLTLLQPFGATYAAVLATRGASADYLAAGEPRRAAALLERVKSYPTRILQNVDEVYASFGRVALEQGDLASAAAMVEPAMKNLAQEQSAAEPVLLAAAVAREQDRLVPAREGLEAATQVVAEDQVQARIAELFLDLQDRAAAAKVIDQLSVDPVAHAQATRLRARSLIQAGQGGAAKAAATEAVEAARATSQVPLLQAATLQLARAELAAGNAARAAALLSELEAAANAQGAGRLLLEVRLAQVQALPRGAADRTQKAKALEADARNAGFLRIARLAREASSR
jgi:tetratricopeptide (TPR) repeat protein